MEVAAGLALHLGVAVAVVFPDQRLLARLLTPQLAAFYEAYYGAKGVTLVKGAVGKELTGEGGQVRGLLGQSRSLAGPDTGRAVRPATQCSHGNNAFVLLGRRLTCTPPTLLP